MSTMRILKINQKTTGEKSDLIKLDPFWSILDRSDPIWSKIKLPFLFYSLQYEENDGAEDNDINVVNHHDLVVDNVEAVTYFAEGIHILNT